MTEKARNTFRFEGKYYVVRGWPDRPFTAVKVYTENFDKWAVNAKGEMFCNRVAKRGYYPRVGGRELRILEGFARLGCLNRKSVSVMQLALKKRSNIRDQAWAAEEFLKQAGKAGIAITGAQAFQAKKLMLKATRLDNGDD